MKKNIIKQSIVALALSQLLSMPAYALTKIEDDVPVVIPKMKHAQVFAQFDDKMPAVLNYFTKSTEQEVVNFYKNAYGDILEQNKKRGRLTLYFAKDNQKVRVVVSTQNNKRQVDILITENVR